MPESLDPGTYIEDSDLHSAEVDRGGAQNDRGRGVHCAGDEGIGVDGDGLAEELEAQLEPGVAAERPAARCRQLEGWLGHAIVIDQDARGGGVFVPFFGRPASTTPTLARIALRTGAAVVTEGIQFALGAGVALGPLNLSGAYALQRGETEADMGMVTFSVGGQ